MKHSAAVRITKGNAGQSIVETVLILPVMILLLMGILDLGRLYFAYITIYNVAREGARYGISHPTDGGGIIAHAQQEADGAIVKAADLQVTYVCDSQCIPGNAMKVTVNYNQFKLITSTIMGGIYIPMRAVAQMEIYTP